MGRRRGGERVLGPYEEKSGWRIIRVFEDGERKPSVFPTEADAERAKEVLEAKLARIDHTTKTAIAEYKKHLDEKGNKADSVRQTIGALENFFPDPIALDAVNERRCADLYEQLRVRPLKRTGKPPSVDTHRSCLIQARTFLNWCIGKRWLRGENPLAEIEGKGKRRPRGKSLGKDGGTLRVKQARAWYRKALDLANQSDEGAIAALVGCLLGMRASEIVGLKVNDLDDDEQPGDLVWIDDAKTEAGRRTLEVPEALRPLLLECVEGKARDRYVFECEREQDPIGKPHVRDWVIDQVHRICDAAEVPHVTAHALRGMLATIGGERGVLGHLIADHLGHDDEETSFGQYARPGARRAGVNRRGLVVLNGGVQVRPKSAK
jgi:integrase